MLVSVKDGEAAHGPQLLPGGQHVLFTLATGTALIDGTKRTSSCSRWRSGERKTLIEGGSDARYVPTGHLVYAVGGSVFAVAFDVQRLEVTGGAVPMVEGVRRAVGRTSGAANFSFSSTGSLVYVPGTGLGIGGSTGDRADRSKGRRRTAEAPARSVLVAARVSRRHAHRLWDR